MKKSLLTILVFGISLFLSSMAIAAPNHGDIEDCDALDGEAYEICESYCFAKACATDGNKSAILTRRRVNYNNQSRNKVRPSIFAGGNST